MPLYYSEAQRSLAEVFIHDNGNVHVVAKTRCGHTSMRNYFGVEEISYSHDVNWDKWLNSNSRRVLVLRNPVDRWKSAEIFRSADGPSHIFDREFWIWIHRSPFLIDIPTDLSFEIIPFEDLDDYIPMHKDTIVSNTSGVKYSDLTDIPTGTGRTQECLIEELASYQHFRDNRKIISPEEWKELTP